jgi:hypothetical protein
MFAYLVCLVSFFITSHDIFKEICKTSFVEMQEVGMHGANHAFTSLIIHTSDKKNVVISEKTATYCKLFLLYLIKNPTAQEITLPFSSDTLRLCDTLLRPITTIQDLHTIQYSDYSFEELQKLYWACDSLQSPTEMQDIVLNAIITRIDPRSNFNKVDSKLINRITEKVKLGFFASRFISGYCRKHSEFLSNNACDTQRRMSPIISLDCSKHGSYPCSSYNKGFGYIFNWDKETHRLRFSIKSPAEIILETEFVDKECTQLIIGELEEKLCIVLKKIQQGNPYYKSLLIDYITSYTQANENLKSGLVENALRYLTLYGSITICSNVLQRKYQQEDFTYNYFGKS